jgi:predicted ArsR family transcriptional regulator
MVRPSYVIVGWPRKIVKICVDYLGYFYYNTSETMREDSFFQTTRGRIVAALKRTPKTATELSTELGLTANAVRQHLARLERDGLVAEAKARRGRTKPSQLFSLTHDGDRLFPQRYDVLLNAVLDEVRREGGADAVATIFRNIGERSARRHAHRFEGKDAGQRVEEVAKILGEHGVLADVERLPEGFVLREHNCPFKETAVSHPQVCTVVHTLMEESLSAKPLQRTSIARGDDTCEFLVPAESGTAGGI